MSKILYGGGLRLMECIRLRIQGLDFGQNLLYIRDAKGGKGSTTLFPKSIQEDILLNVVKVRKLYNDDIANGYGKVYMQDVLSRKYPNAARGFRWQYVFPANDLSVDPRSGTKGGIIFLNQVYKKPSRLWLTVQILINELVVICFVIYLQSICWKRVLVSVFFKSL